MGFRIARLVLFVSCLGCLCQCVSVIRTPPLSGNAVDGKYYGGVAFTSGRFLRGHEIIGIIQTTQEGYRTTFFGEVNQRQTSPEQILRTVGRYAKSHGADGIQHFSLRLDRPKSEEEDKRDKVLGALEIVAAIANGDHGRAAGKTTEGEVTKYLVMGELVRWQEAPKTIPGVGTSTHSIESKDSISSKESEK